MFTRLKVWWYLNGWWHLTGLFSPNEAARALGKLDDPCVIDSLIKALGRGSSRRRTAAAQVLGELGGQRAVAPLANALRSCGPDNCPIRGAAAEALGRLRAHGHLIDALRDKNEWIGVAAAEALGNWGYPMAVEPLRKARDDKSVHRLVGAAARRALEKSDTPDTPLIRRCRKAPSPSNPDIDALIKQLGDRDGKRRAVAARALGDSGNPRAVGPLIEVLGRRLGAVSPPEPDCGPDEYSESFGPDPTQSIAIRALGKLGDPRGVEPLIATLEQRPSVAAAAATAWVRSLGHSSGVEPLIAKLKHSWHMIAEAAAAALGELGDLRAVEPLIAALGDRLTSCSAAESLGKLGDKKAVPALIEALRNPDDRDCLDDAAMALGELGAVKPLIDGLLDEQSIQLRTAVAFAFGRLAERRALDALIEGVKDANIRGAIDFLIKMVGHTYSRHWNGSRGDKLRSAVVSAIEALVAGDWRLRRAVDPLILELEDARRTGDNAEQMRRVILSLIEALAGGRSDVPSAFKRLIEDEKDHYSERAAELLGKLLDTLVQALDDSRTQRRRVAAQLLGKLGDQRCAVSLSKLAAAAGALRTLMTAREQSQEMGETRAVTPMISKLGYWRAAAEALETLRKCAVGPLIVSLRCGKPEVRGAAATALGDLKDTCAVEPLIEAMWSMDSSLRWRAAEALGKLGDKRAVVPVIESLRRGEPEVRGAAATALGDLKDTCAVEPLIEAMWSMDSGLRWRAAEALGKLGDKRAVEPLIVAMCDITEDVRLAAAEALGKLGDPRAVEPLTKALSDAVADVREAAAGALRKLRMEFADEGTGAPR